MHFQLLSKCKSKKDRLSYFYKFLQSSSELHSARVGFNSIFLLNGTPIYDLFDIPDESMCLLASVFDAYKGISLLTKKKGDEFMLENNKNSNDEFKNKHMNYWNARIKLSALTRVNEKKAENSNEGIKFNFKKVKQKSITDDINLEKTVKSNYKNKKYLEDSSNTINKPTRSKISKIDKIPNFDKLEFDKLN